MEGTVLVLGLRLPLGLLACAVTVLGAGPFFFFLRCLLTAGLGAICCGGERFAQTALRGGRAALFVLLCCRILCRFPAMLSFSRGICVF
jgi:hypothetical protein